MFSLFYGFYHYFEKFVHYSSLVKTIINLKSKKHENNKEFFAIRIHPCGGGHSCYGRVNHLAVYIAGKKSDNNYGHPLWRWISSSFCCGFPQNEPQQRAIFRRSASYGDSITVGRISICRMRHMASHPGQFCLYRHNYVWSGKLAGLFRLSNFEKIKKQVVEFVQQPVFISAAK